MSNIYIMTSEDSEHSSYDEIISQTYSETSDKAMSGVAVKEGVDEGISNYINDFTTINKTNFDLAPASTYVSSIEVNDIIGKKHGKTVQILIKLKVKGSAWGYESIKQLTATNLIPVTDTFCLGSSTNLYQSDYRLQAVFSSSKILTLRNIGQEIPVGTIIQVGFTYFVS